MRAALTIAVLSSGLLVASCATPPPVEPVAVPFEVPEEWSTASANADEHQRPWWFQLGDESLHRLVIEALDASPTLQAAAARVDAAGAFARVVGADAWPHLTFGASAQRQRVQFFAPGFGPQSNRVTTHSLSLSSSWELDLWGRVRAGHEAALADVEAATAVFEGARLSLIAQVVKGHTRARDSRLRLMVAESDLNSVSDLAERIRERYEAGLRPALDLRLTLTEVATTRARAAAVRGEHDATVRALEALVGRYPAATLSAEGDLELRLAALPAGLPAELLERRPDLVAAERRLAGSEARFREAQAALLPRIALTASGGSVAEDLGDILDGDFGVWTILGNLTAPILDGGRLRAGVDGAAAAREESIALYLETALVAFAEVESALRAEVDLRDQETAFRDAVGEAREALTISQERYFTGLLDIIDVLAARRSFFNAQSALLSIQSARILNRVDLIVALGGDFERSRIALTDTTAAPAAEGTVQ